MTKTKNTVTVFHDVCGSDVKEYPGVRLPPGAIAIVCGGRDYKEQKYLFSVLDDYQPDTVITGGASGADYLAAAWARSRGKKLEVVPADWEAYGRSAGPRRNREMLKRNPHIVFAFPGGRGTADMIKAAKQAGVRVVELPGEGV